MATWSQSVHFDFWYYYHAQVTVWVTAERGPVVASISWPLFLASMAEQIWLDCFRKRRLCLIKHCFYVSPRISYNYFRSLWNWFNGSDRFNPIFILTNNRIKSRFELLIGLQMRHVYHIVFKLLTVVTEACDTYLVNFFLRALGWFSPVSCTFAVTTLNIIFDRFLSAALHLGLSLVRRFWGWFHASIRRAHGQRRRLLLADARACYLWHGHLVLV